MNNELNEQLEIAANIIAKGAIAALIMCALAAIFIHPAQGQSVPAEFQHIPMSSISSEIAANVKVNDQYAYWYSNTQNWGWMQVLYNFDTKELMIDMEQNDQPMVFPDCTHSWIYEDLLLIQLNDARGVPDRIELHTDTGYLYWRLNGRTTCYPPTEGGN
jgi:hypothetical protein